MYLILGIRNFSLSILCHFNINMSFSFKFRYNTETELLEMSNISQNDTVYCILFPFWERHTDNSGMIAMTSILMILIILSNGMMLIGMIKTKQTKTRNNRLYMLLCISDLILGCATLPLHIYINVHKEQSTNCILETIYVGLQASPVFSGFIIVIISVNVSIAITYPNFYRKQVTNRRFIAFTVAILILNPIPSSVTFMYYTIIPDESDSKMAMLIFGCSWVAAAVFVLAIYIHLILFIRIKARKSSIRLGTVPTYDRKSTIVITRILLFLIVAFVPIITVVTRRGAKQKHERVSASCLQRSSFG